ncbi:hypothetical protein NECAME_04906 [Necator americanus]|uniref:Uncharacterized protein n=1 Tax=Necator americanus TaxID=51031 RepID=W2SLR0_NECAM|nr:hypothetical protein NECAME_04906 [Necator americanus]ETN70483.1 hypothetical protein NECAME_04906 [Necator americanus]
MDEDEKLAAAKTMALMNNFHAWWGAKKEIVIEKGCVGLGRYRVSEKIHLFPEREPKSGTAL